MAPTGLMQARLLIIATVVAVLAAGAGCGKKQDRQDASTPAASSSEQSALIDTSLLERIKHEKWKGDLDGMVERRYIRALVTYNKTYYYFENGEARGVSSEALQEFEKYLNNKLQTGKRRVQVILVPVPREELIAGLVDGRGDISTSNLAIIPEALDVVAFSDPVRENAAEIIVTGPNSPTLSSIDDLGGKEVYVSRQSRYWFTLIHLNEARKKAGKSEIILRAADEGLEDEDILEMINAGLVGITVIDQMVAELWVKYFDNLTLHADIVLTANDRIGWAFRKDSPKLAAIVNEFVKDHKVGTPFGNTLVRRYFQNEKRLRSSTSGSELKKFRSTVALFNKYSNKYGLDWLIVAALAYQESGLDQSLKSPAGAVGVMQIKPTTAAGDPINIKGVENLEPNIHAAIKYMRFMLDEYFKDAPLDRVNKGLFAAASYNAGPNKIARMRKLAAEEGLDPNRWFNNVELIVGRELGRETVNYVSNIYKYYVAYKLVLERDAKKKAN